MVVEGGVGWDRWTSSEYIILVGKALVRRTDPQIYLTLPLLFELAERKEVQFTIQMYLTKVPVEISDFLASETSVSSYLTKRR